MKTMHSKINARINYWTLDIFMWSVLIRPIQDFYICDLDVF